MMIGIIVVIIGGVVLHQNKDEILLDINKNIEKIYEKPITNKDAIKFIQETMKCCGAKSFNDFNITDVDFPKSCCRDQSKECEAPKESLSIITPDEQYFPVSLFTRVPIYYDQFNNSFLPIFFPELYKRSHQIF